MASSHVMPCGPDKISFVFSKILRNKPPHSSLMIMSCTVYDTVLILIGLQANTMESKKNCGRFPTTMCFEMRC